LGQKTAFPDKWTAGGKLHRSGVLVCIPTSCLQVPSGQTRLVDDGCCKWVWAEMTDSELEDRLSHAPPEGLGGGSIRPAPADRHIFGAQLS
jgi:hypothetical protein